MTKITVDKALLEQAIDTLGYYASVCGEDDQETPAKRTQAALRAARAEPAVEPVAAQHRFRHPQNAMPDWSPWQQCPISNRVASYVDSLGYEVEYRNLYASPPPPVEVPLLTDDDINDTVTRLMALADDYADWAMARGQEHPAYLQTRQALQDELTKLFTPLSADEKLRIALDCNMRVRTGSGAYKYATAIENAHGIGETK